MDTLTDNDMHFVVSRLPKDVRDLILKYDLFMAGGFIRATIAREKVSDIDLFGKSSDTLKLAAQELTLTRNGRLHESKNAYTILAAGRVPVQAISRWTFGAALELLASFDFTIAQSVIWFDSATNQWESLCANSFYSDLAARRLTYTEPLINQDAGGSLLRMRKFLGRGYTIQAPSMAMIIARLISKIDLTTPLCQDEHGLGLVLTGLLREVDPLTKIDGIEATDEQEIN